MTEALREVLRDRDIRTALDAALPRLHPGAFIRHEVGLCAGQRRVDVAVITREGMHGYEIKSDADTLARLAGQAEAYGRVFDRMSLVATERHLAAATAAVPPWWEILLAQGPALHQVRAGTGHTGVEAFALAQLLWREEALAELRARGAARGLSRARRWLVWTRLAQTVPLQELGAVVRDRLVARTWESAAQGVSRG